MLTSRFEKIKMKEDETFSEFYVQLRDIVNFSHSLREKISDMKVIEKIFRSLPQHFD